jgi:hypothetical protein
MAWRGPSDADGGHFSISIHTFSFERKGSSMLDALAECVAKNEKKYKNFKPSLEKTPEAVKDKI